MSTWVALIEINGRDYNDLPSGLVFFRASLIPNGQDRTRRTMPGSSSDSLGLRYEQISQFHSTVILLGSKKILQSQRGNIERRILFDSGTSNPIEHNSELESPANKQRKVWRGKTEHCRGKGKGKRKDFAYLFALGFYPPSSSARCARC